MRDERAIVGKLAEEIKALVWTLAGTGLVLICLQGRTLRLGMAITGVSLAVYIVAAVFSQGEE